MWFRRRKKRKQRSKASRSEHYLKHKELARGIICEKLLQYNQYYGFEYKRVSIRNQKTCWGSCSAHGNLNFNYKIIFLPETLMDYVIVHELCHLKHLDHSRDFWNLVGTVIPDHRERRNHLRKMTHVPAQGFPSSVVSRPL